MNTEIFAFIAVIVFKLSGSKVLFINGKVRKSKISRVSYCIKIVET